MVSDPGPGGGGAADGICRRGLLGGALALAGAGVFGPGLAAIRPTPRSCIAFHADRLYLDASGSAEPYRAPAGLRSLDGFTEEALRRLVYHP